MTNASDHRAIDWAKGDGLVPAIVQHAETGAVLMLGYMNADAYARTIASGQVTFWSRSRGALWVKGETSGNGLALVDVAVDCDGDALLVRARPAGPTCHFGTPSCFDVPVATPGEATAIEPTSSHVPREATLLGATQNDTTPNDAIPGDAMLTTLATLDATIASRARERPAGRYTTSLFDAGLPRIAQKVGEEGVETALALVTGTDAALLGEAADLVYHLIVALRARGFGLADVARMLASREGR